MELLDLLEIGPRLGALKSLAIQPLQASSPTGLTRPEMPSDLDPKIEFLDQFAFDGRLKVLSRLNSSTWETDQTRSADELRTSNDQELSFFIENPDYRMAASVSVRLTVGVLGVKISAHNGVS
jgi:hypothetical protein